MERRIFGLENEYGVTCTLRGQRRLSPDEVARYLFRRVVSWGRSSNVFLQNGARLYLDVGSHPEYATPECDSIHDVVVHDKAGERILEQLLTSAENRLADEGINGDIYLFKNNTDSAGNSYGCHENYLTGRKEELAHYTNTLIPFLVTRQIYAGAGKVLQTARGAMFCISQRAEHIWEGTSSATTRSRPIINTRDCVGVDNCVDEKVWCVRMNADHRGDDEAVTQVVRIDRETFTDLADRCCSIGLIRNPRDDGKRSIQPLGCCHVSHRRHLR